MLPKKAKDVFGFGIIDRLLIKEHSKDEIKIQFTISMSAIWISILAICSISSRS
jgi:uncharacterized membrane protein